MMSLMPPMPQWTAGQVHDTVAAIAARLPIHRRRESLLGRFFRWIFEQLDRLLGAVAGRGDARIFLVVVVVVLVAIVVARTLLERKAAERHARLAARIGRSLESHDAWAAARSMAESGDYAGASVELYGAVVGALRAVDLLQYHRSKTAGDYVRDLRHSAPAIATEFRSFTRDFDRVVFGFVPATRADYERLLIAAEALARRTNRSRAA